MSPRVVLPGDVVLATLPSADSPADGLIIGPGCALDAAATCVRATTAGIPRVAAATYIAASKYRYIPSPNEPVIGVITMRTADSYRVDIGAAHPATLDHLAFEGATKRNRPELKPGTLIYGVVVAAPGYADAEVTCVDATTGRAEGYGELSATGASHVVSVSLGLAQRLLSRDPAVSSPVLKLLGREFPFECAVGTNGRVWFKAATLEHVVVLVRVLADAEGRDENECRRLIKQVMSSVF